MLTFAADLSIIMIKKTVYSLLAMGCCLFISHFSAEAQVLTSEDSLAAGLLAKDQSTVISGMGKKLQPMEPSISLT